MTATYVGDGSPEGTIVGRSGDKIGFFGVAPTAQAAITPTVGSAVAGTAATSTSPFGYTTAAQADAIVANVNALRVDLLALVNALEAKGIIS